MPTRYGDWPPRSPGPPSGKLTEHRQKLIDGIRKEIAGRPRGRPWSRFKHCSLRISGKKMSVDDEGHLAAIVDSDDEVKEWYEQQLLDVEAGKLDERIKEHLESIPPRRKRT